MDRREFLRYGVGSAVLLYSAVELPQAHAGAPPGAPALLRAPLTSLSAFLDTLIPADITPSASQLGLGPALVDHASSIENYPRLLELGCAWLDDTAMRLHRASFAAITEVQREAIVSLAEASGPSIARLFFERIRYDLFGLYYASPASWPGLLSAAPQPSGYMDFAQPPRKHGHD